MPLIVASLQAAMFEDMKVAFQTITMRGITPDRFTKIVNDEVRPDRDAFNAARQEAVTVADAIARQLSNTLAIRIDTYIKSASVTTLVPPGPSAPVPFVGTIL